MVSEGRKPAWMLALWGWDIVLYVTSTAEKQSRLLVREMDSVCGAATPAHQSSTIMSSQASIVPVLNALATRLFRLVPADSLTLRRVHDLTQATGPVASCSAASAPAVAAASLPSVHMSYGPRSVAGLSGS